MSVYEYTTIVDGKHIITQNNITSFLKDDKYDTTDLKHKVEGEQFGYGLKPIVVANTAKRTSEAQLRAIKNYRKNHKEKYNEYQKELYHKYKEDPKWYAEYLNRAGDHNTKYREKNRRMSIQSDIDSGKLKNWDDVYKINKASDKIAIRENMDLLVKTFGTPTPQTEQPKLNSKGLPYKKRGRPPKKKE